LAAGPAAVDFVFWPAYASMRIHNRGPALVQIK